MRLTALSTLGLSLCLLLSTPAALLADEPASADLAGSSSRAEPPIFLDPPIVLDPPLQLQPRKLPRGPLEAPGGPRIILIPQPKRKAAPKRAPAPARTPSTAASAPTRAPSKPQPRPTASAPASLRGSDSAWIRSLSPWAADMVEEVHVASLRDAIKNLSEVIAATRAAQNDPRWIREAKARGTWAEEFNQLDANIAALERMVEGLDAELAAAVAHRKQVSLARAAQLSAPANPSARACEQYKQSLESISRTLGESPRIASQSIQALGKVRYRELQERLTSIFEKINGYRAVQRFYEYGGADPDHHPTRQPENVEAVIAFDGENEQEAISELRSTASELKELEKIFSTTEVLYFRSLEEGQQDTGQAGRCQPGWRAQELRATGADRKTGIYLAKPKSEPAPQDPEDRSTGRPLPPQDGSALVDVAI